MIDGAHVLTPGVLRFGMLGLRTYAPAMVATQQWYVGPGPAGRGDRRGLRPGVRGSAVRRIDWPLDGYRLFEIGHFIGERDWFDGLWESNCLFVPRRLLEQVGGFDEAFSMPGGGLRQPRPVRAPRRDPRRHRRRHPRRGLLSPAPRRHDHQPGRRRRAPRPADPLPRALRAAAQAAVPGPGKPLPLRRHDVPKRRCAPGPAGRRRAFRHAQRVGADGFPSSRCRFPTSSAGRSPTPTGAASAWRERPGSGERVERSPTDLLAYQELIATVRPDWIIETRRRRRARASSPRSASSSGAAACCRSAQMPRAGASSIRGSRT